MSVTEKYMHIDIYMCDQINCEDKKYYPHVTLTIAAIWISGTNVFEDAAADKQSVHSLPSEYGLAS
jgi:hypothetical protein